MTNKSLKSSKSTSEESVPVYNRKELFLPKKGADYFIYKPASPTASLPHKILNFIQLAYYKYQLSTGLYMMNGRERTLINFLVLASVALTIYHFVL